MKEGNPTEQNISDAEIVGEVKNEAENLVTDFNTTEYIDDQKTEIGRELSIEDEEKVEAISGSLKEELEAFKAEKTGEKNEQETASPKATEVKKEEKKKDDKKPANKILDYVGFGLGVIPTLGVSIFKRVGNYYQKIKSFFTGKPAPQNKK